MPRQRMIVPIFIPHQGCPYRCVFCNQNKISGTEREEDQTRLDSAFNTYLKSRSLEELPPIREAAFYGGTFTALPVQRQEFLLSSIQVWVDQGYIRPPYTFHRGRSHAPREPGKSSQSPV